MAHETSPAGATSKGPATPGVGRRRQFLFAAGIVGVFLLVGVGLGFAGRFGMEFMIDLFDVHENPTSDQYVGIVFLVNLFVLMYAGILFAGVAGVVTGLSFRSRRAAATIAGGSGFVGYLLLVIPALVIMVSVLGGGGGGGGGGGPSLPFRAIWLSAVAATIVAATSAAVSATTGH